MSKKTKKNKWLALLGEFEEKAGRLVFLGKEREWSLEGQKPQRGPDIGNAIFSERFSGGTVKASVAFSEVSDRTACELILFYNPATNSFLTAGLGGGADMFHVRQWHDTKWTWYRSLGDRANLKAGHEYEIAARVTGSRVSLAVDGVDVTTVDLPFNPTETQVGVWCCSTKKVVVSAFEVTPVRPFVFAVMQFSSPYNEIYTSVIKGVCQKENIEVVRADEECGPGIILADVINRIVQAKAVIAEISTANPNVYYEVGYAHALGKPTIIIAHAGVDLPFDVSPFRTLFYEDSIHGKEKLEKGLAKHLRAVLEN